MSLECGELVYTLEKDGGGGYFAFIYEVGVVGTTYRLLYSDGSLEWVDAKNVGKLFTDNEQPEVEAVEPVEPAQRTVVPTHSDSEGDEILESIPLGGGPPEKPGEHYVQIQLTGAKKPDTAPGPTETAAPEPWFHAGTQTMEQPLTREKPSSRRKRISMRVRPKPKKTGSASLLCCCRSKSYESI
jgi:hypothetical protein